ncbi:MAG: TlpA family protein disulfide reductase [Lachnospiraceae bacterium]|nr:TlpA family protein disulfide reductase [Lachnospiraceae bacterium]
MLLVVLIAVFILLIAGASLLYNRLGDSVKNDNLATQSGADKTTSAETEHPPVSETDGDNSGPSADTETTTDASNSAEQSSGTSSGQTSSDSAEQELTMAPDFTVYDGEGNPVNLSDFIGKPVILNFWASWCGPCKNEMPDFQEAYQEYGDDIQFLMVNCTDGFQETVETAKKFITNQGYTFPVFFDTDSDAAYTYGASSIPMTFFIDAEGHMVAYGRGMLDRETLQIGIDMIYTPE